VYNHRTEAARLFEPRSICGCLVLAGLALCFASYGQSPVDLTLSPQVPVQSLLVAGEARSWQIEAQAGEFVRLAIQPNGLALRIRLTTPDGAEAVSISNRTGESRPVSISQITAQAGRFVLECSLGSGDVPARGFELRLAERRPAADADRTRIQAERLVESARTLQDAGSKESLQQAVSKFEASLPLWDSIGDKSEESHTLDTMSDVYIALGENQKAEDSLQRALSLARAAGDTIGEADVLVNLGTALSFREPKKALEYLDPAIRQARAAGDRNLEAAALSDLGSVYLLLGDPRKALPYVTDALAIIRGVQDRHAEMLILANAGTIYYAIGDSYQALDTFRELLPMRREQHDRRGEGTTLYYMGTSLARLGDLDQALDSLTQALPVMREVGDARGEGRALTNLGSLYLSLGQPQESLNTLQKALELTRKLKDRHQEESILTAMAHAFLQLGDTEQALEYGEQALKIQQELSDRRGEGLARAELGSVYASLGQRQEALEAYRQSLPLLRGASDQAGEADTLNRLGALALRGRDAKQALPYFEQASQLLTSIDDRRRRAATEVNIGAAYRLLGDKQRARDSLREASAQLAAIGDRFEQSRAMYLLALMESDDREWDQARQHLEDALRIDEQIRAAVLGADLRSTWLATVLDQYDALEDALMHLDQLHPGQGFGIQAFDTAERARARTLLDLLSEARAGLREGVDPALINRERILTARLQAKMERQIQLLVAGGDNAAADAVATEIRQATAEYQQLEAKILTASPRYADFAGQEPLQLDRLQREYLDPGTLLLEYAPGEQRSFLWAVSRSSFQSYVLPSRTMLDALAERARESISSAADPELAKSAPAKLEALSRAVLGPVARELGAKRLLIVTSGSLQFVPFSALPSPNNPGEPLIASHEVVNLPSASTIAFLRRNIPRNATSKLVAVMADPVFAADDPRVTGHPGAANADVSSQNRTRGASVSGRTTFDRLTFTRREGENILALAPAGAGFSAFDFDASRATVLSGALRDYKYVHIASHGLVNPFHPELPSIVLSLVGRDGSPRDGFLQAADIYNLRLNADLVVLSACQTALGKDVRGEGVVGLARAFMYAGSPAVVASLWTVPDRSTSELMREFYRGMLVENLRPAAALRRAQIALWKDSRWTRPYYWAAFTLQGEWK
jgi:CHAT domain-containing protein/tetratricopeptide (TPR) repeat protein